MKDFFRQISPRRAVKDLASQWGEDKPHRWRILALSMAITFAIFYTLIPKSTRIPPAVPEVTYISTFAEDRTEAEIIASNCTNQRFKDELEARLAEREELRREMFKALGRATFIDVDEIEAEAEAERAREQATEPDDGPTEEELALSIEEYCARAQA